MVSSSIKVYTCDGNYYLGGCGITTTKPVFSKTYNDLPSHDIIHFSFYMGIFDSWDPQDGMQIKFGTITIEPALTVSYSLFPSNLCGNTGYKDLPHYQVQGRIFHNSSSLDLELINLASEPSTNESFGFREILLVFLTNVSQRAQEMFAQSPTYGLASLKYTCDYDFTSNSCQTCHTNCSSCFGPSSSQCFECSPGYFFNGDTCMFCFYYPGDDVTCHTECEYPLIVDPNVPNTCKYPCDDGQIVWSDGTCHDICQYPLLRESFPKGDACEYICGGDTNVAVYSYTWDMTSCYDFCPSPLRTESDGSCDPPLCGAKICSQCLKTSDCNENYVCNTTIGGFCILNVEYRLSASLVKSITNGYVLLVQVNPTQDLIASVDDVLKVTVDQLISGTDYKLTKKRTALGVFQVTIVALQALTGIDQISLSFGYSPTRLKLTTQISLPNVVFISESITKAAESIGSASNLGSYIFMVCIVAFAILGNANKVWSSLIINQYMHYLLFLSVEYLSPTQTYLESLGNYSLIFFQGETDSETDPALLKDLKLAWPQKFIDENYPINLLESTKQIFIILGIMCSTVFLAAMILGLNNYFVQIIIRAAKKLKWNGLLQQVLTYSLPLTLASLMQINLAMFSKQSTIPSFIFSIIIFLFLVVFFGKALLLISNIPAGNIFDRVLYSDRYGALWRGLDLKTKWSRYYYWVVAARGVFLAYTVALFSLFPYVQVTLILLYQCFVLSFYFWEGKNGSVFVDKLLNRFSLLAESLLLVMKFMILAFKMVNDRGENDKVILYTALGIVGVGMGIQILLLGFSLFMQIKNRKQILRKLKDFFRAVTKKEKKAKIKRVRRVRRQERKMMIHVQVSHIGGHLGGGNA